MEENIQKKPNWAHVIGLLFYVILFTTFVVASATVPIYIDESKLLEMKISQVFSVLIAFVLPAVLFVYFFTNEKFKFFNFKRINSIKTVGITTAIFVCALPAINGFSLLNNSIHFPDFLETWMRAAEDNAALLTKSFLQMDSIGDLLLNIIVIALAAAFTEELFFRGVLQNALEKVIKNQHLAIWIAAILFSALHGQFYGFIPRMLLGAILGYLYVWSGNLWIPIIGHFVNNAFAVLLAFFIGIEESETLGGSEGFSAYLIMIPSIIIVLYLMKILKKQTYFTSIQALD